MEPVAVTPERRGRKRRRKDEQSPVSGSRAKRPATRGKMLLVGRYVKKDFNGSGVFLGKIVFYEDGLYRVDYEDGDCEDLDSAEVKKCLVEEGDFDKSLMAKKNKLDEYIANTNLKHAEATKKDAYTAKVSSLTEISNGEAIEKNDIVFNDDRDISSDEDLDAEASALVVPAPELPPSSGNIGVPEEYVSYLLSVYGFLRSFSIQLFLSPFGLDDFVGSINCFIPNTLMDAIHVALMRVLRRHLEMLSSDGSGLASKCMRLTDWSLLDTLTWPIYLVQYLMIMGHISGPQWKGFHIDALEKDYYSLPTGRKLIILQILCDDVLESVELRSEIDIREEAEVGIDPDSVSASDPETGPKRVHPRYSKTSACKDEEAVGILRGTLGTNPSNNSNITGVKDTNLNENADTVDDANGDECRLCGMDGTLLCCDGCPSAYHSRCIGVNKNFIPEGTWYCPECVISRSGLSITKGTSLTGAQFFGIDLYGHIFLGTCNHLLVLEVLNESEPCIRYYQQKDIPKVLQALFSCGQHVILYSDICKGIIQYWDIQKDVMVPFLSKIEMEEQLSEVKDNSECPPVNILGGESHDLLDTVNIQKDVIVPFLAKIELEEQLSEVKDNSVCHPVNILGCESHDLLDAVEDKKQESLVTETDSENIVTSCVEKSSKDPLLNRSSLNNFLDLFFESKEDIKQVTGAVNRKSSDICFYKGLHFKPQAYLNNYSQGDFAASAAANLAVISSEEKEVSESHALDKRRKMALSDNLLQMKAFSSVAVRFFWPTTERKLVEVPRERCGWCLSCKAPASSRRGCFLNAAASNAIKGAMKILSGLPVLRIGEGRLCAIATYIIFLEESLFGLIAGSFLNAAYRKQWRKQAEQATTRDAINSLLLELEENICAVALSPDWFKLVDSWLIESSVPQSAIIATGSTQKRGLRGRRGRKPSAVSEAASDDQTDSSVDFTWWRGGIFSKFILQRGVLPHSVVRKAARQGGSQSIPGIVYAEGSEVPKRSRQYFWRAAVEMSKNASELALQVRRLDNYVRWSDLVRPEQTPLDGKGQETEASSFRNAFVCDKKNVEGKIIYGVAFKSQKHLPSRVMKNVIETEKSLDGREKYWFSETRIPLYLIKEYEEQADKMQSTLPDKPVDVFSNLQKRQLKACRKDIFSYMTRKRDNLVNCSCASCQMDVLLGNAVKCNVCEGFCHERCTIGSTSHKDGKIEHLMTCKLCHAKSLPQIENESPTSPLLFQGKDFQNLVTAHKGFKQTSSHKPLTPVGNVNSPLEIISAARVSGSVSTERRKMASWGIIFKKNKDGKSQEEKKKEDEDGLRFRMTHIVGKSNPVRTVGGLKCHYCDLPYNPDLMYIHCDTCKHWFHTDALELEETKIFDVVGFKCCKCRRIRSPVCPYSDPSKKKTFESKKLRTRGVKGLNSEPDSLSPAICDQLMDIESTSLLSPQIEEYPCISGDDPLLYSLSMVEQFPEPNSEIDNTKWNSVTSVPRTGPQKLQVRRNNDKNTDWFSEEGNFSDQAHDYSLSPCVEWDVSGNDDISFDCNDLNFEDMEFEPQTYFSFNELLAPDDEPQVDDANNYVDDFGNNCGDLQNGFTEEYEMGDDENTLQENNNVYTETRGDVIICQGCSLADAGPYLCCEICGLCFHSHCSPWIEHPWEGQWRCGKCRDWR